MSNEIIKIQEEITKELANKEVMQALVTTTFKGLDVMLVKRAVMEGMMRGFTFKDFLERNIYAIPFKDRKTGTNTYSLVTSLDYARKIGMRSGVVGKSEPVYEEDGEKIVSCTVTVKRKVNDYIGDYSAKVYFSEYNTGYQLWASKPRTMIAKVAEMHALRMACPEELSQTYVEEEMEKEVKQMEENPIDLITYKTKLENCANMEELKVVWAGFSLEVKKGLADVKEAMKKKYENTNIR